MPLVNLFVTTSLEDLQRFSFGHAADHNEIDAALLQAGLAATPPTVLDPFPALDGILAWLIRHQQKHSDVNAVLNIAGDNLLQFDFSKKADIEAFIDANFSEHDQWHQQLGV